jgi:hypothetical protein
MTPKCARCDDTLWVCEAHNDLSWDRASPRACQCGAPGMLCPECNARDDPRDRLKLPPGFGVGHKGPPIEPVHRASVNGVQAAW